MVLFQRLTNTCESREARLGTQVVADTRKKIKGFKKLTFSRKDRDARKTIGKAKSSGAGPTVTPLSDTESDANDNANDKEDDIP